MNNEEIDRIVTFINREVKISGTEGLIIGMSGGIDSAVVYKLAVKAIGEKQVHPYYLPMENEAKDEVRDILSKWIPNLNIFPIGSICEHFGHKKDRIVYGNVQARIRMVYLYQQANVKNCMVIGTTNKTEYNIGYFTKYGDGAVDLEPILHLDKGQVYEIAYELGVPDEFISAVPTAGLWYGQSDEEEIGMKYRELDEILYKLVPSVKDAQLVNGLTVAKALNIDIDKVMRVVTLYNKSKHKRELPRGI